MLLGQQDHLAAIGAGDLPEDAAGILPGSATGRAQGPISGGGLDQGPLISARQADGLVAGRPRRLDNRIRDPRRDDILGRVLEAACRAPHVGFRPVSATRRTSTRVNMIEASRIEGPRILIVQMSD